MEIYGLSDAKMLLKDKNYSSEKIASAIKFANESHANQFRKSFNKEPFISHCINVGDTLAKVNCNEDTVIAGILHDTIEDTFVTKQDISNRFGKNVAELVNYVTEQDKSKSWMQRFEDYIEVLKKAPKEAQCISAADKIDNMNSITCSLKQNYNIFSNMKGTPQMQLDKFNRVFEVVKNNIPIKLNSIYQDSLNELVKALKNFKF